jgi:hypothetical protein
MNSGRQRVIRRNRVFVLVPIGAILASAVLMGWEILRLNLSDVTRSRWPWRLTLLDLQSAATIFTVLVALLLTRSQYAQVARPMIGCYIHPGNRSLLPARVVDERELTWAIDLFNGGGVATIESIEYDILFSKDEPSRWLKFDDALQALEMGGLASQKDYIMIEVGSGSPFLSTTSTGHEMHVAVFTAEALRKLYKFLVRIEVKDGVGDVHERIINCVGPGERWSGDL